MRSYEIVFHHIGELIVKNAPLQKGDNYGKYARLQELNFTDSGNHQLMEENNMFTKKITVLSNKQTVCKLRKGKLCTNYCRDCRYMEMDNDAYNDGTRRCAYKGEWLRPSTPACANFQP